MARASWLMAMSTLLVVVAADFTPDRVIVTMSTLLVVAAADSTLNRVVVTTEDGRISGIRETSTKGRDFYSFWSIPYARPPLGDLRLKDPVVAEGWEGMRDGSVLPSLCSQIPFIALVSKQIIHEGSEDCLYLSVFTPKPREVEVGLPVMVFIHGGGFFAGGASKYTPYVLLDRDMVLVLLQYRLGVLGFLSTEDHVMPGNFGLKDQTMALRWIQKNIHSFGGDPTKVTLFGESAGGASVHFHYLSPHSQGLFARGILQSGTLFSPWAMGAAFREVAEYTGRLFGCRDTDGYGGEQASQRLLECLQEVTAENLTLSLSHHILFNFNPALIGPRVDGDYLPVEPEILMSEGHHKNVDVISGITAQEGGLFASPLYSYESMMSGLLNNFSTIGPASLDLTRGDKNPQQLAAKVFRYYVGMVRTNEEDADNMCELFGDRHFNIGHDLFARLYARNVNPTGRKVFLYTLSHRGQHSLGDYFSAQVGMHWVSHVDDLFYLFTGGNTIWKPLEREEDLHLRDLMTQMWLNFAETGNPTPDESLGFVWVAATPDNLHYLDLTPHPTMKAYTRHQVMQFWESLPTKQNKLLNPNKVIHLKQDELQAKHPSKSNHRADPRNETKPQKHDHSEL